MTQDFKHIQHELAAWLRAEEGAANTFTSIEPRRLAIYRRLVHNAIRQFLQAGFPVLQQVLTTKQWRVITDEFIGQHRAHSPVFSDIGAEFVDFVATFDLAQLKIKGLPAWLFELAHYERLEVDVLHASFDEVLEPVTELTDATQLHLNSTAVVAVYQYPVASISSSHKPEEPLKEPCCMLVYRKPAEQQVSFMQINTLTALVLEELGSQALNFTQLFERLQVQLPNHSPEQLAHGLLALIQDFCERFVLFTKP